MEQQQKEKEEKKTRMDKQLKNKIGLLQSSLNGALDGLELDNRDDVIEKSVVIEQFKELLLLVSEAQSLLSEKEKGAEGEAQINSVTNCPTCGKPRNHRRRR